jgi:hypothetical protein
MIHYLLLYQFAFLYCVSVIIGLLVYGSDISGPATLSIIIPLIGLPIIHRFFLNRLRDLLCGFRPRIILLIGGLLGTFAYRELHFSYWDEHSLEQGILIGSLGLFSYIASLIAVARVESWRGNRRLTQAAVFLLLALTWWMAMYYPMFPLFAVACILMASMLSESSVKFTITIKQFEQKRLLVYMIFLLMCDQGLMIWDYQVDTSWAEKFSVAAVFMALGMLVFRVSLVRIQFLVYFLTLFNFSLSVIWPEWMLAILHAPLLGLCLGWCLAQLMLANNHSHTPLYVIGLSVPIVLALIFGKLFYANIEYSQWRLLLILPALWFMYQDKSKLQRTSE